jgi:hypothetical protein
MQDLHLKDCFPGGLLYWVYYSTGLICERQESLKKSQGRSRQLSKGKEDISYNLKERISLI